MSRVMTLFARHRELARARDGSSEEGRDDDARGTDSNARAREGRAGGEETRAASMERADGDDGCGVSARTGAGADAGAPATYGRRKRRRDETKARDGAREASAASVDAGEGKDDVREGDSASTSAVKSAARRRTQMCLDLGQASMRHATCARCGFLYAKGDPTDEKAHARFHATFINGTSGAGGMTLKLGEGQTVVWESEEGDVRCVALDGRTKNAVERIARGIERELSMPENWICEKATGPMKAFVCVASKGDRVVGALFAEKVKEAYRTLPDVKNATSATQGTIVAHGDVPERASCGIRAIWTHSGARRRGYARTMLNSMRAHLVPGYIIPLKECAFTQPTEAGTALALSYCEDETFLVY